MVDGTGRVSASGGLETGTTGNVVAGGGLVSKGKTVLEKQSATRVSYADGVGGRGGGHGEAGGVEVDASLGTFFDLPDDGRKGSANVLSIKVRAV